MTEQEVQNRCELAAAALGEHFDAVQIMVSWQESGITRSLNRGCGNWFARQGMAREFITEDQSRTLAREIVDANSDEL